MNQRLVMMDEHKQNDNVQVQPLIKAFIGHRYLFRTLNFGRLNILYCFYGISKALMDLAPIRTVKQSRNVIDTNGSMDNLFLNQMILQLNA